jgi:hypothetical protein
MTFFSYKNKEREGKTCPVWGDEKRKKKREDIRKVDWKMDMVEIFCTHTCKWKNETC